MAILKLILTAMARAEAGLCKHRVVVGILRWWEWLSVDAYAKTGGKAAPHFPSFACGLRKDPWTYSLKLCGSFFMLSSQLLSSYGIDAATGEAVTTTAAAGLVAGGFAASSQELGSSS